jgi:hypothetical protein
MDTQPAEYIRHRLLRFREAIEEIRVHYPDLSPFGRYYAGAPYYEKSGILLLLDGLTSDPVTRENLCTEFRQVLMNLEALENELGDEYRAQLRQDLSKYTDAYAAAVCHEHLGSVRFEADHDLFRRDLISVLVHELERDHDLAELRHLISALDSELFASKLQSCHGYECTIIPAPGRNSCHSDQSGIENQ